MLQEYNKVNENNRLSLERYWVGVKGHEYWMRQALIMAQKAADMGEVPVGAVVVKDDELIAAAHNQPILKHDPTAHAEIQVLRLAGEKLNNYRLIDTQLYVTLEPCAMCAGAMIHARIGALFFAASDAKTGAAGSVYQLLQSDKLNHRVPVEGGLLADESTAMLQTFFRERRKKR